VRDRVTTTRVTATTAALHGLAAHIGQVYRHQGDRHAEKRKVGSSTLPLTTRFDQAILSLTCGAVTSGCLLPPPPDARL
jgi:hypothetical protein